MNSIHFTHKTQLSKYHMYSCDFQNPCDKKLESKIIILTKYLLHLKFKLYVQNYNSLHLYAFTFSNT